MWLLTCYKYSILNCIEFCLLECYYACGLIIGFSIVIAIIVIYICYEKCISLSSSCMRLCKYFNKQLKVNCYRTKYGIKRLESCVGIKIRILGVFIERNA